MSWSRTIRWGLLIAAIGAAGYFGWQRTTGERAVQAAQKSPAPKPIPVKIATVEKADFPVYLTGLGTVQGFNTVVVRTRVDGQINKIAFLEGDLVDLTIDAGADHDGVETLHRAEAGQVNREIGLFDRGDFD